MKTNLFLTGLGAILLSVTGANAMEYRPFVGATMGVSDINFSKGTDDFARINQLDFPTDFFAFGIEGGTRFGGYNDIYNGGVSLNIDMTDSQKIRKKFADTSVAKINTFEMSATYDNYIRISGDKTSRIDFVLGAGMGVMDYNIDYKHTITKDDETIYSTMFAFKTGLDFELTKNITLSAQARMFVPTRGHYKIDAQYIFGGAVKYMF